MNIINKYNKLTDASGDCFCTLNTDIRSSRNCRLFCKSTTEIYRIYEKENPPH